MEHCYSYNFTKKSCKLFKIKLNEFTDFNDFLRNPGIRSVIDPGAEEFKLSRKGFEECNDIKTDKAWFKLLHLLFGFGFHRKYDVKKNIEEDIKSHTRYYPNYAECVKEALSQYIELLRTGIYPCAYKHMKFYGKMSVEELVDLLKEELLARATIYQDQNSKETVIVEIADYYYDYDALYKKYGIDPEDNSSESYNNFISYITTSEHTELLKKQQTMRAEMYGE